MAGVQRGGRGEVECEREARSLGARSPTIALRARIKLACEQALIFVVIIGVARAAKPRVTSRRAQRAGDGSGTRNDFSCQTPRRLAALADS